MKARYLFIMLLSAATCFEGFEAIGRWTWSRTVEMLAAEPEGTARAIVDGWLIASPPAVLASRRLPPDALASLQGELASAALGKLAERQRRHMPAAPFAFVNQAQAAMRADRIDEAVQALQSAFLRDPTNPFALRLMAACARYQGLVEDSLEYLAAAESVAPGFRRPPIELSDDDEQWVRLEALRRRLDVLPRLRHETTVRLSRALRAAGRSDEALRVLEDDAGNPKVDLIRARWYLEQGQAAEAAQLARQTLADSRLPDSIRADAWAVLASVLESAGDSAGALSAAQRALGLDPTSAEPYLALSRIAEGRDDLEQALQHCRRAWGTDPANVDILRRLARLAEAAGQLADAQNALERAVELEPEEIAHLVELVDFHLRHGAYMEAALTLSAAMERWPTSADLLSRAELLRRETSRR